MYTSFWTDAENRALESVTSFEEMVPVAVGILERMAATNTHIIQICGPMSTGGRGSLVANMAFFKKALAVAVQNGACVFDQTPFEGAIVRLGNVTDNPKEYCMDILHVFYRGVFMSGLLNELMFLPDWETSVGARWEYSEGSLLRLKLSDYPDEWLRAIE